MEKRKILVLATATVALLLLGGGIIYLNMRTLPPVRFESIGYPTLGKSSARVEMVLFEDFRCSHCCTFNKEIFPQIYSQYIAKGKVIYRVVPLAFLKNSKPIANAVIAVYRLAPFQLFSFLEQIFFHCQNGEVLNEKDLLRIARNVGNISLPELQECIENQCYYHELEKNLQMAHKIMGKDFGTPTLYLNGIPISTANFRQIQTRVDKALQEEGSS
jgi:protein-disulfide isomerase